MPKNEYGWAGDLTCKWKGGAWCARTQQGRSLLAAELQAMDECACATGGKFLFVSAFSMKQKAAFCQI